MTEKHEIQENTKLKSLIDDALDKLDDFEIGTKEYAAAVDQLNKLMRARELEIGIQTKKIDTLNKQEESIANRETKAQEAEARVKEMEAAIALKEVEKQVKELELKTPFGIKPDTLALLVGNLAGILVIVTHERANVITTKAFGLLSKLK